MQRLSGCYRKAVTILAAQSSSSRQPLLSCKSLYSFRLHYTTGLRKLNTFRSIPATFVSATCSPLAASVWARLRVAAGCDFVTVFAVATVTLNNFPVI